MKSWAELAAERRLALAQGSEARAASRPRKVTASQAARKSGCLEGASQSVLGAPRQVSNMPNSSARHVWHGWHGWLLARR
jgi:hypothetical protein